MKLSVSVPDDLWSQVHQADNGPSETVQRGLRSLLTELREADRPLANAPDQEHLDRYRPAFDAAVDAATRNVRDVLEAGYRLGLLLAPGMVGADFDALDDPGIAGPVRTLIESWGEDDDGRFTGDFLGYVETVLNAAFIGGTGSDAQTAATVRELLGGEDEPGVGVRWVKAPSDDLLLPSLSTTFADGIVLALRDVRDEALRRLSTKTVTEDQQ